MGKKICRKIIRKYIHIYILACLRPPIGCKYEVEMNALHHMLRHMLALKPFCLLWQLVMAPSFKITPANLKGKSSFAPQSKPHLVLTYKKRNTCAKTSWYLLNIDAQMSPREKKKNWNIDFRNSNFNLSFS